MLRKCPAPVDRWTGWSSELRCLFGSDTSLYFMWLPLAAKSHENLLGETMLCRAHCSWRSLWLLVSNAGVSLANCGDVGMGEMAGQSEIDLSLQELCRICSQTCGVSGKCFTCGMVSSGLCHLCTWSVAHVLSQTPNLFPGEQVISYISMWDCCSVCSAIPAAVWKTMLPAQEGCLVQRANQPGLVRTIPAKAFLQPSVYSSGKLCCFPLQRKVYSLSLVSVFVW